MSLLPLLPVLLKILIDRSNEILVLRMHVFRYWGWGGEDDDLFARLKGSGLNPQHLSGKSGTFRVRLALT